MRVSWLLGTILLTILRAGECLPSKAPTFDSRLPSLLDATLDELRNGLDSGLFTSVDLVSAYLSRIDEVHSELHAVTEINPDALSIAADLDAERQRGSAKLGPLHGIPILVKDNIATDDKMNTTAGSYALLGAKVYEDSTVAAKLRRAGAILLGKANLSQWASSRESLIHDGWSAYGGQTVGAYFPKQNPRGSSSGSAVGVSVGLAWAALGTDTGGSITVPAHQNNAVGLRPSLGLTSRYLVVPYSEHMDTVGPLTRTVKDAAYLLSAIAGPDGHDEYTARIPFDTLPDYVGACKASGLQGKRIGVPRTFMETMGKLTSDIHMDEFDAALDVMRSAGAIIVDNLHLPGPDGPFQAATADSTSNMANIANAGGLTYPVPGVDFMTNLPDRYLSKLKTNPHNIHSLADLLEFTKKTPAEGYPTYQVDLWETVLSLDSNNTSPEWQSNWETLVDIFGIHGFVGAFKNHSLDAIVSFGVEATMASVPMGTPILTVPLGRVKDGEPIKPGYWDLVDSAPNKPFGISFSGPAFSEETLFSIAYAFEQLTQVRRQVHPIVQPKTELIDVIERR